MDTPLIYYWTSNTRGTERLARKLDHPTRSIADHPTTHHPYILLAPTYDQPKGGHTPPQVTQWLQHNSRNLVGVIGTGNRTFGTHYCQAAQDIAQEHTVPLLTTVELMGTPEDVQWINEGVAKHWHILLALHQDKENQW